MKAERAPGRQVNCPIDGCQITMNEGFLCCAVHYEMVPRPMLSRYFRNLGSLRKRQGNPSIKIEPYEAALRDSIEECHKAIYDAIKARRA